MKKIPTEKFLNSKNLYNVAYLCCLETTRKRKGTSKGHQEIAKISKSKKEFIRYIEKATIVARLFGLKVGKKMDWVIR